MRAAHRGHRAIAPENTMPAFEAASGRCSFVELDVQLSRDCVPVVIHDETLLRTTDVLFLERFSGRAPWRVAAFSLEELRTLDAGGWFYRDDPFGTVAAGTALPESKEIVRIPTLVEVLRFAGAEELLLNVEIKDMRGSFEDAVVIDRILGAIEAAGCTSRVLVSSFNHDYLKRCSERCPQLATAALQEGSHPPGVVDYLRGLGVAAYHTDDAIVSETLVKSLREAGFFVGVFTVNDPQRSEELFGWGVNAVFADRL